jgi:hypothetical protein
MGTRHLIAVQYKGRYVVAQYGQFDGYPSGQGVDVLAFCRRLATEPETRATFEAKATATKWLTDAEGERIEADAKASKKSWQETHPWLSRDAGSDIFDHVLKQPEGIGLVDTISFAGDSLMCEWAYVLDLDKDGGRLEVFRGFQKKPLDADERFAGMEENQPLVRDEKTGEMREWKPAYVGQERYYPVKLKRWWPLSDLPDLATFKAVLEAEENDDDAEDDAEDVGGNLGAQLDKLADGVAKAQG